MTTLPPQRLGAFPLHGSCPCSHVRYTLTSPPMVVHACHCTNCQRETGTAFALNAFYERDRVIPTLSTGETGSEAESKMLMRGVPSERGGSKGQVMVRCPECFCVLWSMYTPGTALKVVRVGTIDGVVDGEGKVVPCGGLRPDAHLFAREGGSKHGWINLEGERVYERLGVKEEYFSEESLERFRVLMESQGKSV